MNITINIEWVGGGAAALRPYASAGNEHMNIGHRVPL
jgi:hypothetical protein